MSNRVKFIILYLFLFAFRTAYGLSLKFWESDELQTYLIGLKWYSTHAWPFFGPDLIVDDTHFFFQIPGALEGLIVGTPFFLLPIPEAPFLFLNQLSLSAIAFLSWYISKRLPKIPYLFVFAWIALLPWTLNDSTHMYNPCYLLIGSVLFFVGFLEAVPTLSIKALSSQLAFALMGFGLFWNMQFHFSWILLPPFVLFAFFTQWHKSGFIKLFRGIGFLLAGSIVPAAFLLPTLLTYGWHNLLGGGGTFQFINWANVKQIITMLARFLSQACFEMPQFVGEHTKDRFALMNEAPWLYLPGIFLLLVGWLQAVALLFLGLFEPFIWPFLRWKKNPRRPEEFPLFRLIRLVFLMLYMSFWFTYKAPVAHAYFILFPLVTVFSFYIWNKLFETKPSFWGTFGKIALAMSFLFHLGFLVEMMPKRSLYSNRPLIVRAIQEKDYRILAVRRPQSIY